MWGPDNPRAGLFTAPPMIQAARGALIFVPSSLLGHRDKAGRTAGQHLELPPYPQNHRRHWHTKEIFIESEVAAVIGGQRAAPRAPEQDGIHSTTAMEAKLNTAQPGRGVPHNSPGRSRAGKDQPLSFPQEITARGSLGLRKWPPVTACLQLQQIRGVTWGQIQSWQCTPHNVSAKTVILKKRYFSDSTMRRWGQPPPHSRQPQWLLEEVQQ